MWRTTIQLTRCELEQRFEQSMGCVNMCAGGGMDSALVLELL
jgi:hypothetical protein